MRSLVFVVSMMIVDVFLVIADIVVIHHVHPFHMRGPESNNDQFLALHGS